MQNAQDAIHDSLLRIKCLIQRNGLGPAASKKFWQFTDEVIRDEPTPSQIAEAVGKILSRKFEILEASVK